MSLQEEAAQENLLFPTLVEKFPPHSVVLLIFLLSVSLVIGRPFRPFISSTVMTCQRPNVNFDPQVTGSESDGICEILGGVDQVAIEHSTSADKSVTLSAVMNQLYCTFVSFSCRFYTAIHFHETRGAGEGGGTQIAHTHQVARRRRS